MNTAVSQEPSVTNEEHQTADDDIPVTESASMPMMVITNEPEIVTESPEFSAENMTSPEAVQYETPVEWPIVELSQADRLEILADINKFKRVVEINPRNAFAWDTLGGNYKALGQYDEAIQAFQKAVSLDSTKAFYFHHLGLVYAAVGRYDDAIDAFERVIEVDPDHSLAHATLGGYYRKNGNEELAKQHIEKARNLLANDENEYNRACMEAICGNTDHSLELLEIALKNKQAYVNWARKDPDLDFIRSDPRFHELLAEYAMKPA
jgi:tetratricopeptide (TPR) repeat protein